MTMRFTGLGVVTSILSLVLVSCLVLAVPTSAANSSHVAKAITPRAIRVVPVNGSSEIYLIVREGCKEIRCLHLLRTSDNVSTFSTVSLPPIASERGAPTGTLNELDFANVDVGYAVEGASFSTALFATYDGARSWRKLALPKGDSIASLTATSRFLYVVTMRCKKRVDDNVGCTNYQLRRSTLKNRLQVVTDIPNGRSYPWGFLGNVVGSGNNVWLSEGAKWSLLVSSHNDGTTLTTASKPKLYGTAGCALSAMSTTSLWAACPGGMQSVFFFSRDAGRTWNTVHAKQWFGTGGGYFDPVSSNVAYLDYGETAKGANLFRITNFGRTVTGVGRLVCPDLWSLNFTTSATGFALCTSNYSTAILERTVNGGVSWSRVTLP
jgi:hypothetical protein